MKEIFIGDLARFEGAAVGGFYSAMSKQVRNKKDGTAYLCVTLGDRDGQVEGRMWKAEDAGPFVAGTVVWAHGAIERYQGKLQINLLELRGADPATDGGRYEPCDFMPSTTKDVEQMWARLTACVGTFTDPHLRALLDLFLNDPSISENLKQAPAAKTLHHAWIGGLLEHVVSLLELCERVARHYPEVHRDLLLAGAILHDIGKLEELSWGTCFGYTTEGQLLGHITQGVGLIDRKIAEVPDFPPRLRTLLLHIVLSHHGRLEFGSPKLPMTAEAILFHYIDDMDAKMHMLRSEFARAAANGASGAEVTEYVRAMERGLLDTRGYLNGM